MRTSVKIMSHFLFLIFWAVLNSNNQQIIILYNFFLKRVFLAEKFSRVFFLFFFFLFLATLAADFHVFRGNFVFLKKLFFNLTKKLTLLISTTFLKSEIAASRSFPAILAVPRRKNAFSFSGSILIASSAAEIAL